MYAAVESESEDNEILVDSTFDPRPTSSGPNASSTSAPTTTATTTPVTSPSVSNTPTPTAATMVVPTSVRQESPVAPPATQKTVPKKSGTIVTFDPSQDNQSQDIKPVAQPKKTGKSPNHLGTLKIDRFAPRTEAQNAAIRKTSTV